MPKPNFKMLVKLQIGARSQERARVVKTPRGAERDDLILIAGGAG